MCTHTHSNVAPPVPHEVDVYCVDPSVAHAETLKKARWVLAATLPQEEEEEKEEAASIACELL